MGIANMDDASRVGLCVNCLYGRAVAGKNEATYYLCERSFTDSGFPKYPRLPVLRCSGYAGYAPPKKS
jgi:hypothetical protein